MNARTIIAGVDGSLDSMHAVVWAAREAVRRDAVLHLVHVWHAAIGAGYPFFVPPTAILLGDAERVAKILVEDATKVALEVESKLRIVRETPCGPPAQTLIGLSSGAEILVIGGSEKPIFERAMFGSVSTHVVSHAACPVAVVRGEQAAADASALELGPVVVGVDGSSASRRAVEFAMEYAAGHDLSLVALQVWSTYDTDAFAGRWALDPEVQAPNLEGVKSLFGDLTGKYPGVNVTVEAVYGRPVGELLQRSVLAELLVVGSNGHGHFTGMLLGSVSAALVHKASGTVVVVRP